MSKTYQSDFSDEKQKTRIYLKGLIKTLDKKDLKIFSLPASNFFFEKMVLKEYPEAEIDCVENDRAVYNKNKDELPVPVNYFLDDAYGYLRRNSSKYDFIWLDLCGKYTTNNTFRIMSILQNGLKDKCIFSVTLAAARENISKNIEKLYNCTLDEYRTDIYPKQCVAMARRNHPAFNLVNVLEYKSNKIPMLLTTFQTW